ncbi:MAG: CapA family protein, partial [bacterium]
GYLPTITGIVFINDRDVDTSAVVYFDEIIDITDDLPIAPQVEIWDSIGEIFVNAQGKKSVTVQFFSRVIDPDSEHHEYFWYFGDDSTSNNSNPIHTYIIEDDHEYTVLLEVKDSTGLWGRATGQVLVDPGPTTFPITVNFVGDIMLARRYELPGGVIDTLGVEGIFDPTLPYLGNAADITVANLESPLTTTGPRHPTKPIVFRGRPENVAGLVHAGIDVVSLANNHIIDYGLEGMRQTQSVLAENGILYSGAGANSYEAFLPIFRLKSGVNIGFLAFCNRTGQYDNYQPYLNAGFNKSGFAYLTLFDLSQQIQNIEASADLIVVEMHSGNEYSPIPPNLSENVELNEDEFYSPLSLSPDSGDIEIRHHAIDEGADLVINHHPHMIQGFEVYNGKLIAHSLGDFTFDLDYPETYPTVILNAKIDATGFYDYYVTPVYIDDYIPFRARGELGIHILDYLAQRSKELGTYMIVDRDSVFAQIVLDTIILNPVTYPNQEGLRLQEESGYWTSKPIKLPRNGSISSILSISPPRNWEVRLGRELTWLWSGNFEDEGSSLWLLNQTDEFYDTIAFQGQRSLCQIRPMGSSPIITNLEERIVCNSDSTPYTLYGRIKTQNADSAGIAVGFYRSRTSGYNGSSDLDTIVNSTSDWAFYCNEFIPTNGTQYFDIWLRSVAPDSGNGYTWFDNV